MAPRMTHASLPSIECRYRGNGGPTLHLTKRSVLEDPHTCWVRPGKCPLPAWSSSSQHSLWNLFSHLANTYSPASSPPWTVPSRSLVSQNSGSGLPHGCQDTQAGPLYLSRCCPSHTGLQSPANPEEEQKQEVSQHSAQQPHPSSVLKQGKPF